MCTKRIWSGCVGAATAVLLALAASGCGASPLGHAAGRMQVAQLTTPGGGAGAPAGKAESPSIPSQAYAYFAQGVFKRQQSDHTRMVMSGRQPADEAEKKMTPEQLSALAEKQWQEAVEAFREALKLDPGSAAVAEQLGDGYLARGKTDEGLRSLNLASDLDPTDFSREYRLGAFLERVDQLDGAIKHFQLAGKAADSPTKDRLLPVVLLKVGGLLQRAGKGEQAIAAYKAFVDLPQGGENLYEDNAALAQLMKNRAPVYRQLGKLATTMGKPKDAVEYYKKSLELDPGMKEAHLLLAQAYVAAGDKDAGIREAQTYIETEPDNPDGYQFLVSMYEEQNRLAEAIDTTEKLLARQPGQYRMRYLLGGMYERTKQTDQAVACYRQVVKEHRVYVPAYLKLAEIYHQRKEDAQALWVYSEGMTAGVTDEALYAALDDLIGKIKDGKDLAEKMRAILPEAERSFAFYYVLGRVSQKFDDKAAAIDAYAQSLKLNPRFIYGYVRLAAMYVDEGKTDEAIKVLESAQTNQIRNVMVYRFLGQLELEKGRFEDARVALQKALELEPAQFETTLQLAQAYLGLKQPQKAEELLKKGMDSNPGDVTRWAYALGFLYVTEPEDENLPQGVELLETCVAAEPDEPKYLRTLATAYARQKEYEKALSTAQHMVKVSPDDPAARYLVAGVYEESGELAGAETTLRVALGKFPNDAESSSHLGRFLIRHRKSTQEGILLLERAVAMTPKDAEALIMLGWAYEQLKDYPKAEEALLKARKVEPENRHITYTLAQVYQSMKHYDQAEKELRDVLAKDPDDAIANNALGYFFAERSQNLDEAATLVKKALAGDPESGAYMDSLGWVYFQQGKLDEALTLLKQAFQVEKDGVISEHLGDVLYRLGKKDEARAAWEEARKLDPYLDSSKTRLERLKKGEDPLAEPAGK